MWKQWGGVVLAILLGIGGAWLMKQWLMPVPVAATPTSTLPAGGDFTLQSVEGDVRLQDFRGKVVVLYFGYTACPDICPTSMATQKAAFAQLSPEEMQQVQGIFISVDPERDGLEHIQRYARYFHPTLVGATGSPAALESLAHRYNAFFRKVEVAGSAMAYTVDHTTSIYLIDKAGKVQATVQHAAPPEELAAAIKRLL